MGVEQNYNLDRDGLSQLELESVGVSWGQDASVRASDRLRVLGPQ